VLVTHDQAEALSFATHLAVLRDGRLAQAGSPRELYGAPHDPEVAAFLGDAIILTADLHDGWAECPLGRIALAPGRRSGKGTILVRPEQLSIAPAAETGDVGATNAVVTGVAFGGASSMVTLGWAEPQPGQPSSFTCRVTHAAPAVGDQVAITVAGTAHVFSG
jgi:iron(III) transport system ATP-binding protein